MSGNLLFLFNLLATWYMVGLIWMVQIVHYPLFDRVGSEAFSRYEADHGRLITPIVGVPMLVELVTAILLVVSGSTILPRWASVTGLGLVIAIWLSTAFLQVPCHNRLAHGFDADAYRTLVTTNWIRTLLWSARGLMLAFFTVRGLQS